MNSRRLALLAIPFLLLASCSRLDMAVRWADTFLLMEADSLFDLTGDQKAAARPEVRDAIAAVRKDVFPKAADLLADVEKSLRAGPPAENQVTEWITRGRGLFREAIARFEPVTLGLAKSATKEQEEHFAEEFNDRIEELKDQVDTPERRLKKDRKRLTKQIENWIGSMNRDQEKALEEFLKAHPTPYEAQIRSRERVFAEFRATAGETRWAWIRRFYADPESFRDPSYAEAMKDREVATKAYLLRLWASLTEKQKNRFYENLSDKAGQIRRLAL